MEAFPPRPEVLNWSYVEVADNVAEFLGTNDYRQEFMVQQVDGELLLDLTRDDCRDLGIKRLRDLKTLLRWVSRYSFLSPDLPFQYEEKLVKVSHPLPETPDTYTKALVTTPPARKKPHGPPVHVDPTTSSTKSKLKAVESFAAAVAEAGGGSPSGIFSNRENFGGPHVGDGEGIIIYDDMDDPLFCYDRIFKRRQPHGPVSDQDLCGKRYLKRFYPEAYSTFTKNMTRVRSWFNNSQDPVIRGFMECNFRHDSEAVQAVKSFIKEREPLLPSLRFFCPNHKVVRLRWKVEDIYHWFLEYKHYSSSKRVKKQLEREAKRSCGSKSTGNSDSEENEVEAAQLDLLQQLSTDDERWLNLCRDGKCNFQLWGLQEPVSTLKLQCRERRFNQSEVLKERGAIFESLAGIRLFGYGYPVGIKTMIPYKVWTVKVDKLLASAGDMYVPCGEKSENWRLQVKFLKEGALLEIPGTFVSLHPTEQLMEITMPAHHGAAESLEVLDAHIQTMGHYNEKEDEEEIEQLAADFASQSNAKISSIKEIFSNSEVCARNQASQGQLGVLDVKFIF